MSFDQDKHDAYHGKSSFDKQYGGKHYKHLAIQPIEYVLKNKLGYCEGSAIKYITRWKDKGGIEDLRKAIHFIEMLIESEERSGQQPS